MKILTILFVLIFALFAANNAQAQGSALHDFSFTPELVDTRDGTKSITFTVLASTNNVPGVSFITMEYYLVPGDALYRRDFNKISIGESGELFQTTMTFQEADFTFTYNIHAILITDNFGNTTRFRVNDIATLGFKTTFQVIGKSTPPPIVPKRKRVRLFQ